MVTSGRSPGTRPGRATGSHLPGRRASFAPARRGRRGGPPESDYRMGSDSPARRRAGLDHHSESEVGMSRRHGFRRMVLCAVLLVTAPACTGIEGRSVPRARRASRGRRAHRGRKDHKDRRDLAGMPTSPFTSSASARSRARRITWYPASRRRPWIRASCCCTTIRCRKRSRPNTRYRDRCGCGVRDPSLRVSVVDEPVVYALGVRLHNIDTGATHNASVTFRRLRIFVVPASVIVSAQMAGPGIDLKDYVAVARLLGLDG
jgi:hypothetical protein